MGGGAGSPCLAGPSVPVSFRFGLLTVRRTARVLKMAADDCRSRVVVAVEIRLLQVRGRRQLFNRLYDDRRSEFRGFFFWLVVWSCRNEMSQCFLRLIWKTRRIRTYCPIA